MHIPDIQRKAQQEFPSWKGMTLHHPLNSPLAFRISQKPIVIRPFMAEPVAPVMGPCPWPDQKHVRGPSP